MLNLEYFIQELRGNRSRCIANLDSNHAKIMEDPARHIGWRNIDTIELGAEIAAIDMALDSLPEDGDELEIAEEWRDVLNFYVVSHVSGLSHGSHEGLYQFDIAKLRHFAKIAYDLNQRIQFHKRREME